jgi:hypothetical protein
MDPNPAGKKDNTIWIVFGVTLLILVGIGVVYYINKDFLNMSAGLAPTPKAKIDPKGLNAVAVH